MTFAIEWVAGLLGPRFAHLAKYVVVAVLFFAILAVIGGGKCAYDRSIISKHDDTANIKVLNKTTPANDHAADQRSTDAITLNAQEKELHDAVQSTPDARPSAGVTALGCARLRRQGTDSAKLPTECRR